MKTEISIYSDVVCPWCYIGKKRLENAIEQWKVTHPSDSIQVNWKPFELNPDISSDGEDRVAHMVKKFGSLERIRSMTGRVADIAKEDGLFFSNLDKGHQPNTFILHALIRKAKQYDKESQLAEIFFRNFFSDGKNLSDESVILESLREAGIPETEFSSVKEDKLLLSEIEREEIEGKNMGVTGVPFYIFNEKYAVSGAQPVELFLQVFDRLESEGA
ncbi:DSBA-like thioredoxin domain protein [Leptospira broomii serovar Hurstbridge str. 5399]|uniref:DSBA-like thioredoxin domain protein n=1 Tax=Leptospira broomii serovar Hurstbridge str. 5399 TaxID=1049789 RepID=T0F2E5_9LEPT|nr:DsbA family oxidoreductase [Leptospira broomii]EQA45295.1 DSBA-like thioredoxin domain protein [Leptospira broomii serovar Hurstbridge str. 5399]